MATKTKTTTTSARPTTAPTPDTKPRRRRSGTTLEQTPLNSPDLGKLIRFGSMNAAVRGELAGELDPQALDSAAKSFDTLIGSLSGIVGVTLADEAGAWISPFAGRTPSPAELRIAHAQLTGWFEGVLQTQMLAMGGRSLEQPQGAQEGGSNRDLDGLHQSNEGYL